MEKVANWGARPVFITSTFQDMQAERDWLWDFVFPAIEERLYRHRQHLEWIDLRLGAGTARAETEAEREAQVKITSRLAVALPKSIKHRRDLFTSLWKIAHVASSAGLVSVARAAAEQTYRQAELLNRSFPQEPDRLTYVDEATALVRQLNRPFQQAPRHSSLMPWRKNRL